MQDLADYFSFDKEAKSIIFTGKKLTIILNQRYSRYGYLEIEGSSVTTLGVFDMVINDEIKTGLLLPAVIEIRPSDIQEAHGERYDTIVLTLNKGDLVVVNTNIVRNPNVAYAMYYECLYLGAIPEFLTYDRLGNLFDRVSDIAGVSFPVNHAVFEAQYQHLYRVPGDTTKLYRLTDRKSPPLALPMQSVAQVATSTTSKLVGAYFGNAINSALVNQSERSPDIEHILSK